MDYWPEVGCDVFETHSTFAPTLYFCGNKAKSYPSRENW